MWPALVAGADVAYARDDTRLFAAVVVLALPSLVPVDRAWVVDAVPFPYVPGLFARREAPGILGAWGRLRCRPDLLLCDGHGRAHPTRFGLACHVGHRLGVPTVGCAKTVLVGSSCRPPDTRGAWTWLADGGERLGAAVRTRSGTRPVFVSPGFGLDVPTAVAAVLAATGSHRIPEPLRLAHQLAGRLRARAARRGLWTRGALPS
jgi:deoxyribonuclease V